MPWYFYVITGGVVGYVVACVTVAVEDYIKWRRKNED